MSCGCRHINFIRNYNRTKPMNPDRAKISEYKVAICEARMRKLEFSLSYEEWLNVVTQNCYFCGRLPYQIGRNQSKNIPLTFLKNGIDRFENSIGYTIENSRTCCKYCNFFKANRSYEETVENAKKICEFQGYILIKKEVLI